MVKEKVCPDEKPRERGLHSPDVHKVAARVHSDAAELAELYGLVEIAEEHRELADRMRDLLK